MSAILRNMPALERALVAGGWESLGPWWEETLADFYTSGTRQLVLRVGRRGGKSSTLCRVAVLEALFGEHRIPRGDVGIVGIVSVKRDEAAARLHTIGKLLTTLKVPHEVSQADQTITLKQRPVVFKVFAASLAGVVGGTWICALCDEVARWRDRETGANPAKEVLGSLRPTLLTMPNAKLFLSSSPLGRSDSHAKAFADGDTDFQRVRFAPTWVANPTRTEAECRALEPDERLFNREYAAIPQGDAVGVFSPEDFDASLSDFAGFHPLGETIMLVDLSGGSGDSATWCAATWSEAPETFPEPKLGWDENGDPFEVPTGEFVPPPMLRLAIHCMGALEGSFRRRVPFDELATMIAERARHVGARRVIGDQFGAYAAEGEFARRHRLHYTSIAWTNQRKVDAVTTLRRWFRDRTLAIENDHEAPRLRKELTAFEERINAAGSFQYGARSGSHDDRVALLINAAIAESEGLLRGSPHGVSRVRREVHVPDAFGPGSDTEDDIYSDWK